MIVDADPVLVEREAIASYIDLCGLDCPFDVETRSVLRSMGNTIRNNRHNDPRFRSGDLESLCRNHEAHSRN